MAELTEMVKALHAAGLEVILDVVFDHTAEDGAGGPMFSFQGIDNPGTTGWTPRTRPATTTRPAPGTR